MARRRKARVVAKLAVSAAVTPGPASGISPRPLGSRRRSGKRRTRAKPPAKPPACPHSTRISNCLSPSPPGDIFPLTSLPPELTLRIASFLRPRSLLAMLLTSPAFAHLSTLFIKLARQEHTVTGRRFVHVYTPLQFFCSRGLEPIVRRLLLEGADPNDVSYGTPKNQLSPLIHAIGFNSASIVSLLLQHGAKVSEWEGHSPLHVALRLPHQSYAQLRPNWQDSTQRCEQLLHIVQLLLDAGADVTAVDSKRGTPLHMACSTVDADPRIVVALLAAGANVHLKYSPRDRRVQDGNIQPIHCAASAGNDAIVHLLLDAGADIEAATSDRLRPLDMAVISTHRNLVVLLEEKGADMCIRDPRGNSASRRRTEVERLVRDTNSFERVTDPWLLSGGASQIQMATWLSLRGCRDFSCWLWG